ncbi:MAG: hypothetical protein IPI07_00095 [Flavobacteriales bacterium]|nr:hypothetical protein [Flavobacteriales bacterium]
MTTDMLVEGVHFDLSYMPLKHLGYKAIVVNLSDVYAMNAEPRQVTVALASAIGSRWRRWMSSTKACCWPVATTVWTWWVVTPRSRSGLVIAVTAIGAARSEDIVYRNGAKDNELLVVSGDLGGAFMGLQILEREKAVYADSGAQPDLEGHDYILERQLKPGAQARHHRTAEDAGVKPTRMIDVSDGLASEALHIARIGPGCGSMTISSRSTQPPTSTARFQPGSDHLCAQRR